MKENGLIEEKTLQQLSVPVHERIKQILINMERSRWVPAEQKGEYLVVNIPDFKLFVFQNDSLEWSCNVIVGESKVTNNTVIFNDNLEYIVFSPYWNIPKNILIKETLPAIKRNPDYLSSHNMEVVDVKGKPVASSSINWSQYKNNFPYIIRQKPGENNALGSVKFLFPNSYEIYMHDTPEKSLFGETTRTFSHGCIRLEEPYKLVKFLLREDTSWTDENIIASMYGGKQTFVKLKNKVPVFIAYFTAWVDRNGNMNFRNDVYSHDEKMKQLLFAD
ncbi:MAG: L,D-transpeptidase family protein [Bacteroidetes bacterium]|nr:L,D-transpeptidase family protein [Bacteroidota bacterium]